MKRFLLALLLSLPFYPLAQIEVPGEQEPCWKKSQPPAGRRYLDFECGKLAGVVDCNEKLGFDERSNTIILAKSGAAFTGVCETCHSNGLLERRINFVNGKEDGKDTTYYRTGCVQVVRSFIQGTENGQWVYYYDSTRQLAWEMNYFVGQKHGKHVYFKKNGDTTLLENYKNGILDGVKRTYYNDGKVEREIYYKEGQFNGSFRIFSAEGKVVDELNYVAGQKDGLNKYYYSDGTLLRTEYWDKGVKNGDFKVYYIQGHLQSHEVYKKGNKEGTWVEYYADQKLKRRAIYKKDVLIEDHQYNADGEEVYTFGVEEEEEVVEDDLIPFEDTTKSKKKGKGSKPEKVKKEKKEKE